MNVASLEKCEELYELSRWSDTEVEHLLRPTGLKFDAPDKIGNQPSHAIDRKWAVGKDNPASPWAASKKFPAYDSGYLLRKLPYQNHSHNLELVPRYDGTWYAGYSAGLDIKVGDELDYLVYAEADTPEDALAMVAIGLFKKGVL